MEDKEERALVYTLLRGAETEREEFIARLESYGVPNKLARNAVNRSYLLGWRNGVIICEGKPQVWPDMSPISLDHLSSPHEPRTPSSGT